MTKQTRPLVDRSGDNDWKGELMQRLVLAAAVALAASIALAGSPARASGAQVIQERFYGPLDFAEAAWEAATPTSITDAAILASQEQDGTTHLSIFDLHTTYLDSNGNVTSSLDVTGGLNGGVSFALDRINLSTAAASGTVPVTRCTFDAVGNPTGCTSDAMAVSATWTGQGEITRGSQYVEHSVEPGGLTFVDRASGSFRLSASAIATIGGQTFDASELQFADFGVTNNLTLTVCPHGC
jgi:hypothetical protein